MGMRTVADLRRALGVGAPRDRDSLYVPIERAPKQFNPLRIPKKLQVRSSRSMFQLGQLRFYLSWSGRQFSPSVAVSISHANAASCTSFAFHALGIYGCATTAQHAVCA